MGLFEVFRSFFQKNYISIQIKGASKYFMNDRTFRILSTPANVRFMSRITVLNGRSSNVIIILTTEALRHGVEQRLFLVFPLCLCASVVKNFSRSIKLFEVRGD